jgi:hypothetical protein
METLLHQCGGGRGKLGGFVLLNTIHFAKDEVARKRRKRFTMPAPG